MKRYVNRFKLPALVAAVLVVFASIYDFQHKQPKTVQDGDWTILYNCRLVEHSANDGDSFHVVNGENEYVFRLYYVDCPETSGPHSDRVADQADYFDTQPTNAIALGWKATAITKEDLNEPFTVYTRWRYALGNSKLGRSYAFIETSEGDDLASILVDNGLARIFGTSVGKNFGFPLSGIQKSKYIENLGEAERKARVNKVGGWQK